MSVTPAALYVHFPFCLSLCPYCDFVVYTGRSTTGPSNRIDSFLDALLAEIALRASADAPAQPRRREPLRSIYLGGGTPSLLSAAQVGRILETVGRELGIAPDAEVTIEANPAPGERGDLVGFRAAGVNRLSVGAQSFEAAELRRLGRRHSAADIGETVRVARSAGFSNVSLDLLYDVPGQTLGSWRRTLQAAIGLGPDHLSAYALALDDPDADGLTRPRGDHLPLRAGARRWRDRARGEQDEALAARCYELADAALGAAGYGWYEISNWARPGLESRHNRAYWTGHAWQAVGPGAHAFDGRQTRRWNSARLDGYVAALAPADQSPVRLPPGGATTTDELTAAAEQAMLRLRTRIGLPAEMVLRGEFAPAIRWARANRLVEPAEDGAVRLTLRGRLLSNEVFVRLLPGSSAVVA